MNKGDNSFTDFLMAFVNKAKFFSKQNETEDNSAQELCSQLSNYCITEIYNIQLQQLNYFNRNPIGNALINKLFASIKKEKRDENINITKNDVQKSDNLEQKLSWHQRIKALWKNAFKCNLENNITVLRGLDEFSYIEKDSSDIKIFNNNNKIGFQTSSDNLKEEIKDQNGKHNNRSAFESFQIFIECILKTAKDLDDEEILEMQIQILKLMKNMKEKRELREILKRFYQINK